VGREPLTAKPAKSKRRSGLRGRVIKI